MLFFVKNAIFRVNGLQCLESRQSFVERCHEPLVEGLVNQQTRQELGPVVAPLVR